MSEKDMQVPNQAPVEEPSVQDEPKVDESVPEVSEIEDITSESGETTYPVNEDVIDKLSFGVLEHCLPDLQKAKGSLEEILRNQTILIETVQQENGKFAECKAMDDLTEMMMKSRRYYTKLMNLKKEMAVLSEKSFKLKKRAVKLQQQKQKEELMKAQQLEREQEKERMLTAKVAKKT